MLDQLVCTAAKYTGIRLAAFGRYNVNDTGHGLAVFGWYRIGLTLLIGALLMSGTISLSPEAPTELP